MTIAPLCASATVVFPATAEQRSNKLTSPGVPKNAMEKKGNVRGMGFISQNTALKSRS